VVGFNATAVASGSLAKLAATRRASPKQTFKRRSVMRQFYRDPATLALFLGIFLTGFGSSYYHWNPNDDTLFWDRLPMTLCFNGHPSDCRRGTS
jgi:hypothetical protein